MNPLLVRRFHYVLAHARLLEAASEARRAGLPVRSGQCVAAADRVGAVIDDLEAQFHDDAAEFSAKERSRCA